MRNPTGKSFNLVTDPWLPVTLIDGTPTTWGMNEFFARSQEARGVNEPSPLNYTATLRMLLAVLHRALSGPRSPVDWLKIYQAGRFNADQINAYLDRWYHRFDIYHPERPFAQVDSGVAMSDLSPVTRLLLERTSGNNPTLFDHSWDANPLAISPGDAARAVLAAHQYAFAGSGGKFMQAPLVAGYCITLEGNSLFQTLMFNLQQYDEQLPETLNASGDAPWWEWDQDPPVRKEGLRPRGLTDLLTWRSRNLRLVPEPDGTVCTVQYGQRYVVRDDEFRLRDPFKRYVQSQGGSNKGAYFPKNFTAGRALWRDADALMEQAQQDSIDAQEGGGRPGIINWMARVAGFMGDQGSEITPMIIATGLVNNQAKIDLWRMDRLPLPLKVLLDDVRRNQVRRALEHAQAVRGALTAAGSRFAEEGLSSGERKPDPHDVARERASLKLDERYWSQLEIRFQQFLAKLTNTDDLDEPLRLWFISLQQLAREAFLTATDVAHTEGQWMRAQVIGGRVLNTQMNKVFQDELAFRMNGKEQNRDANVELKGHVSIQQGEHQ
jgi:CRISPR system Cascade subunit CasA